MLAVEAELMLAATTDFQELGAEEYVVQIRCEGDEGRTNMAQTAARLGYTVREAQMSVNGRLMPRTIWVKTDDPLCRKVITVGHELGHHFLTTAVDKSRVASWGNPSAHFSWHKSPEEAAASAKVEAFCDYFAHRLISRPPCLSAKNWSEL